MRRQAIKAKKASTDQTTPGEADPDRIIAPTVLRTSREVGGISSLATCLLNVRRARPYPRGRSRLWSEGSHQRPQPETRALWRRWSEATVPLLLL